jgi:type VI secretion system protein ImpF
MAWASSEKRIVSSMLDRLLDDDPQASAEPPAREAQVIRDLQRSLRRDLEDLLNSRRPLDKLPEGLAELPGSLANYGLPDLQSLEVREVHDVQRLCRIIEDCIRRFEPRLHNVVVGPVTDADEDRTMSRRLRFAIDAILVADPYREPVHFRSDVDSGSGAIVVEASG